MTKRRLVAISASAVLGTAVAVATAGVATTFREPDRPALPAVSQVASATDGGFTVTLRDAVFSGTETVLRLVVSRVPSGEPGGAAIIDGQAVALEGFALGDAPGTVVAADASVLLRLPPVDGTSTPVVTLGRLIIRGPASPNTIAGAWRLPLVVPPDVGDRLKTEALSGGGLYGAGGATGVTGVRSRSETVVRYTLSPDVRELSPPKLRLSSGELEAPFSVVSTRDAYEAHFRPTPFGQKIEIMFGPLDRHFGVAVSAKVFLNLAALVAADARVAPGASPATDRVEVPVGGAEVDGAPRPPLRSLGLGQDRDGRRWIAVELEGSWRLPQAPGNEGGWPARVFGANGKELMPISADENFRKTTDGRVEANNTIIQVVYEDVASLMSLRIELGAPREIIRDIPAVTLSP